MFKQVTLAHCNSTKRFSVHMEACNIVGSSIVTQVSFDDAANPKPYDFIPRLSFFSVASRMPDCGSQFWRKRPVKSWQPSSKLTGSLQHRTNLTYSGIIRKSSFHSTHCPSFQLVADDTAKSPVCTYQKHQQYVGPRSVSMAHHRYYVMFCSSFGAPADNYLAFDCPTAEEIYVEQMCNDDN